MIDITLLNTDHPIHHQSNIFLLQLLAGFILCYCHYQVCNLPADWETCSWKGQLGKPRSWKLFSWKVPHEIRKNEVGKFGLKLKSDWWSWKVLIELGMNQWSWKATIGVGKINRSWSLSTWVTIFKIHLYVPILARNFQLRSFHSNFARLFPT